MPGISIKITISEKELPSDRGTNFLNICRSTSGRNRAITPISPLLSLSISTWLRGREIPVGIFTEDTLRRVSLSHIDSFKFQMR